MRLIDLSYDLYEGMVQFPGPKVTIFELPVMKGQRFELFSFGFVMPDHIGTHVDAPRHMSREGEPINEVPLEKLITEAVVLNLTHKEVDSLITAKDLKEALRKSGEQINPGDGILLYTGWDKKWGTEEYKKNPGISVSAAKWLLEKKVSIIGIDGLRLDHAGMEKTPTESRYIGHTLLLRDNKMPHVENLRNLDKIKQSRVIFIALPPKIKGAGGAPVRAVAIEGMKIGR